MGYLLLVTGVILSVSGIVMIVHKKDKADMKVVSTTEAEAEPNVMSYSTEPDANEQKGMEFEIWVKDHFNKKYFTLKEWRSDKYDKGTYAESNRYPDMEWEFHFDKKNVCKTFAVECKWRKDFFNESIEWASEENINIYNRFSKERNMSVFVIIGVGGSPSSPAVVYSIPLKALQYPHAKRDYLEKFCMEDLSKNFYYDYKKDQLR